MIKTLIVINFILILLSLGSGMLYRLHYSFCYLQVTTLVTCSLTESVT